MLGRGRAPRASRLWGPSRGAGRGGAGRGRHAFLRGAPYPVRRVRRLGKRSGASVGARWVLCGTSRFGEGDGSPRGGWLGSGGLAPALAPRWMEATWSPPGGALPRPFRPREGRSRLLRDQCAEIQDLEPQTPQHARGPRGGAPQPRCTAGDRSEREAGAHRVLEGLVVRRWFSSRSRQGVGANSKDSPPEKQKREKLYTNSELV